MGKKNKQKSAKLDDDKTHVSSSTNNECESSHLKERKISLPSGVFGGLFSAFGATKKSLIKKKNHSAPPGSTFSYFRKKPPTEEKEISRQESVVVVHEPKSIDCEYFEINDLSEKALNLKAKLNLDLENHSHMKDNELFLRAYKEQIKFLLFHSYARSSLDVMMVNFSYAAFFFESMSGDQVLNLDNKVNGFISAISSNDVNINASKIFKENEAKQLQNNEFNSIEKQKILLRMSTKSEFKKNCFVLFGSGNRHDCIFQFDKRDSYSKDYKIVNDLVRLNKETLGWILDEEVNSLNDIGEIIGKILNDYPKYGFDSKNFSEAITFLDMSEKKHKENISYLRNKLDNPFGYVYEKNENCDVNFKFK